ncbi:serine/threonine protein phosphatase 2B catalytic subunit, putative [Entamoeba invadens IP1]|uniref:Serine/threonine-protein phosphatase n=2 Tax=Entamoeba invadens TaxID=33085 RepID=L7FPF2_ENTIV|nr:serine/threonine protein phosphatase 2B catalytic subunit, putative [Entamoeba invadens IP1]ELP94550.1 serine/threonine protein phosphatase 2B catalytic subunit, putative [Entamoeba invadens IP1]BAN42369.1 serine/threonine protein phosphatase 2B catalytic subunit, putative [Entamoeba invadens]|eukprot:XP_004261321.1 serine/threonine protein phosphatase 2B catalytic subunit, putative [Entamoeba invadens IP1]
MSSRRPRGKKTRSASVAIAEPNQLPKIAQKTQESDSQLVWDTILAKPVGDDRVKTKVPIPETRLLPENFLYVDGKTPNLSLLRSHLVREGLLHPDLLKRIITEATNILKSEPNMIEAQAPVIIVGDLHGQFYDMMTVFDVCPPENSENNFIFLGDYVDRGNFSTEILIYLCACKINYPKRFMLLRGNHESRIMAENMTFSNEFMRKYNSSELLKLLFTLFDSFPIAVRVGTTELGDFLCCHGGFSPDMDRIADYSTINRFVEPPTSGPLSDILWSDPIDEPTEDELDSESAENWLSIDFVENTSRMTSVMYGAKSLLSFLEKNNITCIVRAHQVMEEGYKLHYFLQDVDVPPCITVFSAPNYCDMYHNKGSFMRLMPNSICFEQFDAVEHPMYLPMMQDSITFSLDALMDQLVEVVSELILITKYTADGMKEKQEDAELAKKIKEMIEKNSVKDPSYKRMAKIRKEFMENKEKNDASLRRRENSISSTKVNRTSVTSTVARRKKSPHGKKEKERLLSQILITQ